MIKLLVVDDSIAELELIKAYFKPFKQVELTTASEEPEPSFCDRFDCVMVDQYLRDGRHGLDFAMKLKQHNWLLPIMLYTGDNMLDSIDAKEIVDEVCYKSDIADLNKKLSCFFRQVNRLNYLKSNQETHSQQLSFSNFR